MKNIKQLVNKNSTGIYSLISYNVLDATKDIRIAASQELMAFKYFIVQEINEISY